MARDLTYDYSDELREARGNHQELVDTVSYMAKKLNTRFSRLEEKGKGLKESAYTYAKAELGSDTPRYLDTKRDLKKLSDSELYDLGKTINNKLKSQSSTLTGIKKIEHKRISNAVYSLNQSLGLEGKEAITEEEFKSFINHGGNELMKNKYLTSTQVVEDWLEYTRKGIKKADFINMYNEFKDKHTNNKGKIDLGKIRQEFEVELRNPLSIHVRKNKLAKVKKGKTTKVTKAYKRK